MTLQEARAKLELVADQIREDIQRTHGYVPRTVWVDTTCLCLYDEEDEPLITFHVERVQ
jgi:hypothetical protein